MKAYTVGQIRAAEQPLLAAGVPLMQRAASALAEVIRDRLSAAPDESRILVLAGAGNNGGDALYAAAELAADGGTIDILCTAERVHEDGLRAARAAGGHLYTPPYPSDVRLCDYEVIIDGILGTGTAHNPALRGFAGEIVCALREQLSAANNDRRPLIAAVDVPSGLHPNTGEVSDGNVLPADVTVTFGAAKVGLLCEPARRYVGELVVADIGLGPNLAQFDT